MNRKKIWIRQWAMLTAGTVCLAFAMSGNAQVQTQSSTSTGQPSVQVQVERAQVVYVSGNDLVVKMEDGTLRHFPNVPDSARVDVDGKMLGVHDLKPGMTLQRTLTTTTTPKVVTTTRTVSGRVWHVTPPNSVILTLEDGTNQSFNIPRNQQFNVNGQMTNAWGLRKGMMISATEVVEEPITQVQHEAKLTGTMPPPPPPPAAGTPILIVAAAPRPAPASTVAAATPPPALPKTGSELPLFGLLGVLGLLSALLLRVIRKTA